MSAIIDWTGPLDLRAVRRRRRRGGAQARAERRSRGILCTFMRSDGTLAELLWRPAGGAAVPFSEAVLDDRSHVREDGRPRGVQARRALDGRSLRPRARRRQAHRQRHRPADPAPGEHPHHRGDGEARRHPDGQGLRERRPLRQHVVRVDPDRARRGDRARAREAGDRRRCSSRSAPASPGARWSSASSAMPNVVLLFPGQGSQKPGMGKDLAERFPAARERLRARRRRARRPALAASASRGRPRS